MAKKKGWDCDYEGCVRNAEDGPLLRVNPRGQKGIFMCQAHAAEVNSWTERDTEAVWEAGR